MNIRHRQRDNEDRSRFVVETNVVDDVVVNTHRVFGNIGETGNI